MNRADCIRQINTLISDDNLRNFIFNNENKRNNFLTDNSNILIYFSNILVLSFGLVFTRFIEWKERGGSTERLDDFTNSMIRIYSLLNKAYDNTIVSFEFVDTLLQNLQIDSMLKSDLDTNFLRKINLDHDYFRFNEKFSKVLYEIQKKRVSSRYASDDINYDSLITFIKIFPYLQRVNLYYNSINDLYVNDIKQSSLFSLSLQLNDPLDESIYSDLLDFRYLFVNNGLSNYFLERINIIDKEIEGSFQGKRQIINLQYVGTDLTKRFDCAMTDFEEAIKATNTKYSIVSDTVVEDFLIYFDITKYEAANNSHSYFFKDFYSFNNSYLKNFALVVADCLNAEIRQALIEAYIDKYFYLFDLLKVGSLSYAPYVCNYDWDALITVLFLEEGIHRVLAVVLDSRDIYREIVQKFYIRFSEICKYLPEKTAQMIKNPLCVLLPSELGSKKKEITCKVNAIINLASELLSRNRLKFSLGLHPSSIGLRIEKLGNVYKSKRSTDEKINYFIENIFQVTKMILVFFGAFFEYAKIINEIDFGIEANVIYVEKSEIDLIKKKAVDIFIREVNTLKKLYSSENFRLNNETPSLQLNQKSLFEIFCKLEAFNQKCADINSTENKTLRRALGKSELIDEEDLRRILNEYKEILNGDSNDEMLKKLYFHTCDYLRYMETGMFDENGDYDFTKAVIPLNGIYSNSIVSRDGYLSAYFLINMPGEKEQKVKILSDDSFQFSEDYFCLPNLNRMAKISSDGDALWVSPIIINYKHFSQNYFAVFSDKQEEKDYPTVSRLIYETDPYIYSALFGNVQNACKVLPILFKMPRSMFSIDKYVTVLQDNKVIAVGSIYSKNMFWDQNIVLSAMKQAGVDIPESFDSACRYFEDTYNDLKGKDKSLICDICVDEGYRNKGVGKFLLMNIIKSAKSMAQDLIITVYADNYPAINLYKSLDFIEYERFLDDRGYNRPQEVCIKMIRFNNI